MCGYLCAKWGPEEIGLAEKVKMICMSVTRWRKRLVTLANGDFKRKMLDSHVTLWKTFFEKWPLGFWGKCGILICRKLEFGVCALERTLNA